VLFYDTKIASVCIYFSFIR